MYCGSSLVAQMVKNLPAVWEIQVQSLGQKDPLEEGMAWVFLPGVVCGQGSLAGYIQSTGSQRAGHNWATFTHSKCTMLDRRLYNGKWSCTGFTMCKTRVWDFGGRDCPMLSLPRQGRLWFPPEGMRLRGKHREVQRRAGTLHEGWHVVQTPQGRAELCIRLRG